MGTESMNGYGRVSVAAKMTKKVDPSKVLFYISYTAEGDTYELSKSNINSSVADVLDKLGDVSDKGIITMNVSSVSYRNNYESVERKSLTSKRITNELKSVSATAGVDVSVVVEGLSRKEESEVLMRVIDILDNAGQGNIRYWVECDRIDKEKSELRKALARECNAQALDIIDELDGDYAGVAEVSFDSNDGKNGSYHIERPKACMDEYGLTANLSDDEAEDMVYESLVESIMREKITLFGNMRATFLIKN